jgi:Protein of unknown function (DUF4058)
MPIRSVKNQYPGVNAHLHSYWQSVGGWSRFHTNHITDLMRAIRPLLIPMGYDADVEPSLQIRRIDDIKSPQYPESDVTIYDLNPARSHQSRTAPQPAGAAELVVTIPEALYGDPLSENIYNSVKIYPIKPGKLDQGDPVAWIELLSPSNKPGGRDAQEYFDKRLAIIENGIVFIEIDYLHESAPTLQGIPNYRTRRGRMSDEDARAYRILVIDPRPDLQSGLVRVKEFDVDAPIPTMSIPLNGEDALDFDFGLPYRKTFEETLYGQQLVDYSQLPSNFSRYSEADQTRIARRMLAVIEASRSGLDLETAVLTIKDLSLDEALAQIVNAKSQ